MIKKMVAKVIGKKLDGYYMKYGVSKTKVVAIVWVICMAIERLAPEWGYHVKITDEIYQFLAACGLWTLRDGIDSKE